MKQPLITNIQKYSIHDGEGIRTTVFFKGCPLSCAWCHNPETQSYQNALMFYEERCVGCGACASSCPADAVRITEAKAVTDPERCTVCGSCLDECAANAREQCARTYDLEMLFRELKKDQIFYETSHGGVTLSGGEVLARDLEYTEALMRKLKAAGIRVNIDTCGAVSYEALQRVLPYTDVFLYDIKIADGEKHRQYTGSDNRQILDNLIRLSQDGAGIWIRIPVIGGVNSTPEDMAQIGAFLQKNQIQMQQVDLLPYHDTGSSKYQRISRAYAGEGFYTPSAEELEELKQVLEAYVTVPVKVPDGSRGSKRVRTE